MIGKKTKFILLISIITLFIAFCDDEETGPVYTEAECSYETETYSGITLVYPGDCDIVFKLSDGTQRYKEFEPVIGNNPDPTEYPYLFLMREGTTNNIIFNFMGGGACWDGSNCLDYVTNYVWDDISDITIGVKIDPQLIYDNISGVIDPEPDNGTNPFADWTLVFLPYTTGDIHWGSNDMEYENSEGETITVHHRGFDNFLSVLRYMKDNFPTDTIDNVFVTGQSAGSYGAIFNFPYIKETYNQSVVHVLGDGGNGVLPPTFIDSAIESWHMDENLADWITDIGPDTIADTSSGELYGYIADYYPESNVAQYTTMYDHNQRYFYYVMNVIDEVDLWKDISGGNGYYVPDSYSCEWRSGMLDELDKASQSSNYHYYVAPGRVHTITTDNAMYDVEADGTMFIDWLNWIIDDDPSLKSVKCVDCDPPVTQESSPDPISCE